MISRTVSHEEEFISAAHVDLHNLKVFGLFKLIYHSDKELLKYCIVFRADKCRTHLSLINCCTVSLSRVFVIAHLLFWKSLYICVY